MQLSRSIALRQILAGLLILVMTLAGVGRGLAASTDTASGFGIAGLAAPICHAGGSDGPAPAQGPQHDCCEACALSAPATLPDAPVLTTPVAAARSVAHVGGMGWATTIARLRSPRQSQGPPAA